MAYTLTSHKGGTVRFMPFQSTVVTEQASYSGKVTAYPIETGANINDHMLIDPNKFSIDGAICGGVGEVRALTAMHENREICTYVGRTRMSDMVIISLSFDYKAQNKYGASFKAQLQHVIITSAQWVETGAVPMSIQDRGKGASKSTGNKGQQNTGWDNANTTDSFKDMKAPPSAGPADRGIGAYNGLTHTAM